MTSAVRDELRRMLVERRRVLLSEIQSKIRTVRDEAAGTCRQPTDPGEPCESETEDDLSFALIHMKSQVLNKINEAVSLIDEGTYGYCADCDDAIALARLRALPFAIRCKDCEEAREHADEQVRVRVRRSSSSLGFEMRH